MHSSILFVITEVVTLLYILILGTHTKFARKKFSWRSAFAFRGHAWALAACLPQDHIYITTDEVFRFQNNKFDEMPCKLKSVWNLCWFEEYPAPLKNHSKNFAIWKQSVETFTVQCEFTGHGKMEARFSKIQSTQYIIQFFRQATLLCATSIKRM